MAIDIYKVLNRIGSNVTRQNKFSCTLVLPSISELSEYDRDFNETLTMYIQQANIPSQSLALTEVKYLDKIKYAITGKDIDTIQITMYDTREQIIRNMFMKYINAITTNSKLSVLKYYPDEYKSDIYITIHDVLYKLSKTSPISVGDFVLDETAENQLGSFVVTFKVSDIEVIE